MTFDDFNLSKNADGLLPAIVQDDTTLKVLMLGYMNREAFEKTVAEGVVTFWSRGRNCLWTKGETSGNYLHVVELLADCDADTLLVRARPDGPTCHRGTPSCFDTPRDEGFIRTLLEVIRGRHEALPEGSYTTKLEELTDLIVETVNGKKTVNERYDSRDIALFKTGVTL